MDLDKDDLAALCSGMTTDEVDRIHRLLHEWSVGPDTSFPVQLALLTRAQWQAAAAVPRSWAESRQWLELHLAEYRRQTGSLLKSFGEATGLERKAFEQAVAGQTEALKKAVAQSNSHVVETEQFTRQMKVELDRATATLKSDLEKVRGELIDERVRMEKARRDLEARMSFDEWFRLLLVSLCMLGIGACLTSEWPHLR